MPKVKERILKASREKQLVTYRGVPIRLSAGFSKETLQARRDWQENSKWWKTRTYNQDYATQKGAPIKLSADFSTEILQARRKRQEIFKAMKTMTYRITLPSKAIISNQKTNKVLPRQGNAKGTHHHQTSIIWNVKGSSLRKRSKK